MKTFRWHRVSSAWIVFVCTLFLLGGCVPGTNQEQSLMRIQSQISVLSNEMQESFVKSEDARIALYKQLNDDIKLLQKNQADTSAITEELRASLVAVDAKLDEYNVRMEKLNERLSGAETALTERIDFLSDQVNEIMSETGISFDSPPPTRPQAPVPDTTPVQTQPLVPTSEPSETPPQQTAESEASQLYHAAYTAYINGNFDTAIAGFEKYLRLYSDSELADISQYWIAESFFSLGEFETALGEYDKLIHQYPGSDKIPAAFFSKADAYLKLDRQIEAISHLKYVISQFPNSGAARKAKERLQALGEY